MNPVQPDSPLPSFEALLRRVAEGDREASSLLVQHYEPAVRRVIRLRLSNLPLQSIVDSQDICQSVMASFLLNIQAGRYELENERQLMGLLIAMARSKVAAQSRFHQARRRDRRRLHTIDDLQAEVDAKAKTPSQQLEAKELIDLLLDNMNEEERKIAKLRSDGKDWRHIAQSLQGNATVASTAPDTLRKRWSRAMQRIIQELGLN